MTDIGVDWEMNESAVTIRSVRGLSKNLVGWAIWRAYEAEVE